ncbi:hypothetical protein EVAR_91822_1, partial [Eumeta japonica]
MATPPQLNVCNSHGNGCTYKMQWEWCIRQHSQPSHCEARLNKSERKRCPSLIAATPQESADHQKRALVKRGNP